MLRFADTIVRQEVPDDGGVEVALSTGDVVRGQSGGLAGGAEQAGDGARFGDAAVGQLLESDLQNDAARGGAVDVVREIERLALTAQCDEGGIAAIDEEVVERLGIPAQELLIAR